MIIKIIFALLLVVMLLYECITVWSVGTDIKTKHATRDAKVMGMHIYYTIFNTDKQCVATTAAQNLEMTEKRNSWKNFGIV